MIQERKIYELVCNDCGRRERVKESGTECFDFEPFIKAGWELGEIDYCPKCAKEKYTAKPCPFCGSPVITEQRGARGISLMCEICLMESAEYPSREMAYEHWNRRA